MSEGQIESGPTTASLLRRAGWRISNAPLDNWTDDISLIGSLAARVSELGADRVQDEETIAASAKAQIQLRERAERAEAELARRPGELEGQELVRVMRERDALRRENDALRKLLQAWSHFDDAGIDSALLRGRGEAMSDELQPVPLKCVSPKRYGYATLLQPESTVRELEAVAQQRAIFKARAGEKL